MRWWTVVALVTVACDGEQAAEPPGEGLAPAAVEHAAPTRTVAGLTLGEADHDAVIAWLADRGLEGCTDGPAMRREAYAYRCIGELPTDVIPGRQVRGEVRQLDITRTADGPAHHLAVSRQYSVPEAALQDYTTTIATLTRTFGEPDKTKALSEEAVNTARVAYAPTTWSFDDLEVTLTLLRAGTDTTSVAEVWKLPGVVAASKAGPAVHGAGSQTAALDADDAGAPLPPRPDGALEIADVYARRAALADTEDTASRRVVKASSRIFGTNWYHLRDGTGEDGTNDLTVTSEVELEVGDVVVATAPLTIDKDLGFGYFYEVILEDADVRTLP